MKEKTVMKAAKKWRELGREIERDK